jgi:hypothetical protein
MQLNFKSSRRAEKPLREAEAPSIFDVSHAHPRLPIASTLQRIAGEAGVPPLQIVSDYARLAFGPGKLSLDDYVNYRLFDERFLDGADKRAFIGRRCNRDYLVDINYRHDWLGLLSNKVASASYLAAYGLPTIPTIAVFAPGFAMQGRNLLRSRQELRSFLLSPEVYPLFGKPVESLQSLGSIALFSCDPRECEVIDAVGNAISVETLVDDIEKHYSAGYVFQELLSSHRDLAAAIGERLATVRIVTIATTNEPKVFRAAWKLPAGGNIADNYWRSGNLLAGVDLETGRVRQVCSGTGFELRNVTHHPDTGANLIGLTIPNWSDLKAVAIEGARLLRHFALVGWDIASTDNGAVIVEANESADMMLSQIADRCGVLDAEFLDLVERQKLEAARRLGRMKAEISKL